MAVSDAFFLPKHEQNKLRNALVEIPTLVEQLAITLTRQARIQRPGLSKSRRQKPESRVPFHLGAQEAADALHNELTGAVRLVCEQRCIHYRESDDDLTLAAWLRKNMVAVALTEGAEDIYRGLMDAIAECWRVIDLPPEDEIVIDRFRQREANRLVVTADQVEKMARRMGPIGHGLNKRRVQTLADRKTLHPCAYDGDTAFYRMGDVLDAHHSVERRKRKPG